MALHWRQAMVCALLLGLASLTAAARLPEQQQFVGSEDPHAGPQTAAAAELPSSLASSRSLLTYYFDATQPRVQLSARGSSRPERTAITVTLPRPQSVSRFMPVVSPRSTGMTHEVANTWQALKNLAVMFSHVDGLNTAAGPAAPRLFPRAALAVSAASDNAPGKLDVNAIITYAQAQGQHSSWAEKTPGSVLLLPFGQSTGAVADVMGAAYDAQADSITLELDIVHQPHTISEFDPHGKQTVEVDQAHYHFDTAPGVKVDAQGLIKSLQSSGAAVEGLHVFFKGNAVCRYVRLPLDGNGEYLYDLTAAVGDEVTIRMQLIDTCPQRSAAVKPTQVESATLTLGLLGPGYYFTNPVDEKRNASTRLPAKQNSQVMQRVKDTLGPKAGAMFTSYATTVETDADGFASVTVVVTGQGPIYLVVLEGGIENVELDGFNYAAINQNAISIPTSCYFANMFANPTQVDVGERVRIDIQLTDYCDRKGPHASTPQRGNSSVRFHDSNFRLGVIGPAQFVEQIDLGGGVSKKDNKMKNNKKPGRTGSDRLIGELITVYPNGDNGQAAVVFEVTGPGPITFEVQDYEDGIVRFVDAVVINAQCDTPAGVPVSKLQLVPAKAYRHVHDSLTLTALALDASNNPVAGATVVFSAESDCNPTLGNTQAVTDANGHATFTVVANQPGVVSVVAAGVNAEGAAVVSAPSHIFFYGNRYDADEREEGYYRRYGSGEDDSEAYRYSKAAAARAVELITRKSA